jgi:hypothetical protein
MKDFRTFCDCFGTDVLSIKTLDEFCVISLIANTGQNGIVILTKESLEELISNLQELQKTIK